MDQKTLENRVRNLKAKIEAFIDQQERLQRHNHRVGLITILLGIGLAIGSAWAGFMEGDADWAAFFGVLTGALITYDRAFNHGEKSSFYQIIVAEGKSLLEYVEFKVDTDKKFEIVLKRFQALRKYAVERLPRGQGMQAVKEMTEELRAIGY